MTEAADQAAPGTPPPQPLSPISETRRDAVLRILSIVDRNHKIDVPEALEILQLPAVPKAKDALQRGTKKMLLNVHPDGAKVEGAKVNGGLRHTSNVADDLAAKREAKAAEPAPGPTNS